MVFHYGMNYCEVMEMPIRAFWFMASQIRRLLAEQDIRSLRIANQAQSYESAKSYFETLQAELGMTGRQEEALDEEGWAELKRM